MSFICPSLRMQSFLDFHNRDLIYTALCDCELAVFVGHHVAYNATAGRNSPRLKLFGLGIKPNQGVWLHSRFAVPDNVVVCRNPVWQRCRATWREPLFDVPGFRIQPAEITARIV